MSTTNILKLVQMLRLRADKNVTRSKMYIRSPDGGYMKRMNPQTNEEEYYTLKRLLLDIKYKAIHSYKGIESSFNEYLIRIVFNHEIVLKSALKSVRDPGHEEAIDAIHGYLSKHHASSLHNTSSLPLKSKIMKDFNVILKKNYHKTTYLDDNDTYIQEDKLIRDNDIQLEDINYVGSEDNSIFLINPAIDIYGNMKKIYADLRDVLSRYSGNDIIFNKYTVTGRDGGKGKMNSFEEESKKLIETIQTLEADYIYYLGDFESRAKEIMRQIHMRLKTKNSQTMRKKQFLHGVMLSLGENIKILDHYIKIFFNEIHSLTQSVRDAIRKQNEKSKVSPKGYGPRASPTFSSIAYEKPKVKEEEDDFYKGMNMVSLSQINDGEKLPALPVADIKRVSPPTTNKTRKNKKKKKKKNKTKKSSGDDENIDDLIGEYRDKDLMKFEKHLEKKREEMAREKISNTINDLFDSGALRVLKEDHSGYIGNYIPQNYFKDSYQSSKSVPQGLGLKIYDGALSEFIDFEKTVPHNKNLLCYIGSFWRGKEEGFGQLIYKYKSKIFIYRGNFEKGRRWGLGEVYSKENLNSYYKKGLFFDLKSFTENEIDDDKAIFVPEDIWAVLKKYYWILRLFLGHEDLFKESNPYDILDEIRKKGKLPIAHQLELGRDEMNYGFPETVDVFVPLIQRLLRNTHDEKDGEALQGIMELLEDSYKAVYVLLLKIKPPVTIASYNADKYKEWWDKVEYGLFSPVDKSKTVFKDGYKPRPKIIPRYWNEWIDNLEINKELSDFVFVDSKNNDFQRDFWDKYYGETPCNVKFEPLTDKSPKKREIKFTHLPKPAKPVINIRGHDINIFEKLEARNLLRPMAVNVDKMFESVIGEYILDQQIKEAEEGSRQMKKIKKLHTMTLANLTEILDKSKSGSNPNFMKMSEEIRELQKKSWSMIEAGKNMRKSERKKMMEKMSGSSYEFSASNVYSASLKTLLKMKEIEERRTVKLKKKGGRRTRKKRGSSREEVCSQLLQRLKMINDQIELGGFDINKLKKDGMNTLKILQKCLKEGLIDITEYMKIKMEYENYFKQY